MFRHLQHIATMLLGLLLAGSAAGQVLPVKSGRLWGLIDTMGKHIVKPIYDAVPDLTSAQAVVVQQGRYGLIDAHGKDLIAPEYTYLERVSDGLCRVNQGGAREGNACKGGKWGLVNHGMGRKLAPTYSLIRPFDMQGLALVNVGGKCSYDTCNGGLWGIVDTTATELLPPQFQKALIGDTREAYVQGPQGWGLYDLRQRRLRIAPKYEELRRVTSTRVAMRSGKLWGLLTNDGDTILEPICQGFCNAEMGYLGWQMKDRWGVMDSMGRKLTPARYDEVQMFPNHWIRYKLEAYYGLSDTSEREITRGDLAGILHFGKGFAIVQRGNTFGAVNRQGTEIVPVRHDLCELANDSLIVVRKGKILRWHTTQGNQLKTIVFDTLTSFTKNRVALGSVRGKWGLINVEGQWIMDPIYEGIKIYFQAAKGKRGDDVDYAYFDELGHASRTKRIVLIREDQEAEPLDLFNVAGSTFSGWFVNTAGKWGLRDLNSQRLLIEPTFTGVVVIPGTNISCVRGKIKNSENWAWGLINHLNGKLLTEFLFESIFDGDYSDSKMARAVYFGSGKYTLLGLDGHTVSIPNATYIGKFVNKVARVNVGGTLETRVSPGMDNIDVIRTADRFTGEEKLTYRYCKGGKWGYVDEEGKWLQQPIYEGALDFQEDVARIKMQGKWGAVNSAFQVVIEPKYDFIEQLLSAGGRTLYTVGRDQALYGFIDTLGEIAITARFEQVGGFSCGLVRVRQGGKWGFADRQGNLVIQPQFQDVGDFHEGLARVRNARAWGFIDSLGNTITPQKYLRAGDFHEGLAWVQGEKFFGYVDRSGTIAITPAYTGAGDFSEGLAPVRRKGAYGLIDRQGRWILQPNYYRIGMFHDSLAVIQQVGDFGLVTPKGDFVVKPTYKEINDFHDGLARFRNGMEYGYLDRLGNTVIASQYSNSGDFACGRALVFQQGRWGYIDTAGAQVVTPQYSFAETFSEDRAVVRNDATYGFIDPQGQVMVPLRYTGAKSFVDGRGAVRLLNSGWGLVNEDGTLVVPCQYDEIGFRQNGIVSVREGRKWGLINTFGAVMTPFKYDMIGEFSEGLAPVMMRRSIGIVDDKGKELLEPHYDTITRIGDVFQVEDEDAFGYMAMDGRWIWRPTK